jgi:predicted nucleic acid-binding protein
MMIELLVDASVAVKWLVRENKTDEARRLLDPAYRLYAPDLFPVEVINTIARRVRRKELSRRDAIERIRVFNAIPVSLHDYHASLAEATSLALSYGQALYDCIYLALAARMGLPYVTADERFINGVQNSRLANSILWLGAM